MRAWIDSLLLAHGWRRVGVAALAGLLTAGALPPINAWPLAIVGFGLLVVLIDGMSTASGWRRKALSSFLIGWGFGFGYHIGGLWWLGAPFLVEPDRFAWALPLGVAGLPAGLAIFSGLGVILANALWSASPWRIAALALGLGLLEMARGTVLTGFPWNALGHIVAATDVGLQSASLVGLYGLGFLAVLMAATPILILTDGVRQARGALLTSATLLVLIAGFGAWRLQASEDNVPGVGVHIVQPLLTQTERLDPANADRIVDRLFEMTARPGPLARPTTLVIWPESTLPFLLSNNPQLLPRIGQILSPGQFLVLGAARGEATGPRREDFAVYNSLYAFDHRAMLLDRYDKVHLVPFGEYLPFANILSALGLEALTRRGYTPGVSRAPISLPGLPSFIPAICYEIIFPSTLIGDNIRPGFILNISDDSWFGDTPGPRQHLLQARVRAVEEGLPVLRGTTTGISAIIDGYGRIRASLPLGRAGSLHGEIPTALFPPLYASFTIVASVALPILLLLLVFFARRSLGQRR
jgi:apolipoprotein N-acyltransferase